MADPSKIGTDWQADELDAIVADYFDMLTMDLAGRSYVKLQHSAALMAQLGRTHRSVEFKHQNISAVLDELGLPWIPGYKPKRNYQNAIFEAIDRYLTLHPSILELSPNAPAVLPPSQADIFVEAPVISADSAAVPERLRRLVRKFDPVERDHRNRSLGKAGDLRPRHTCHRRVVIHFQHPKDRQDAKSCLWVLRLRQGKIRCQFGKLGRNTNRGFTLGRNFADVRIQSLRWLMLSNEPKFCLSV